MPVKPPEPSSAPASSERTRLELDILASELHVEPIAPAAPGSAPLRAAPTTSEPPAPPAPAS